MAIIELRLNIITFWNFNKRNKSYFFKSVKNMDNQLASFSSDTK